MTWHQVVATLGDALRRLPGIGRALGERGYIQLQAVGRAPRSAPGWR